MASNQPQPMNAAYFLHNPTANRLDDLAKLGVSFPTRPDGDETEEISHPFRHGRPLPLKTPDRKLLSTESPVQSVRKRAVSPSATLDEGILEVKRKQVSKCLQFGSPPGPEVVPLPAQEASRCLFGNPSEEENSRVRMAIEERLLEQYREFTQRWVVIEDEGEAPCFPNQ